MTKNKKEPWFRRYEEIKAEVASLRVKYIERCDELKIPYRILTGDLWKDFISRAVHESNWQEGIKLDRGRTREMGEEAFRLQERVADSDERFDLFLKEHRKEVLRMQRKRFSFEEIAAFNLTAAYGATVIVLSDIIFRELAEVRRKSLAGISSLESILREKKQDHRIIDTMKKLLDMLDSKFDATFENIPSEIQPYLLGNVRTPTELISSMVQSENADASPLQEAHLHFLHTVVMRGTGCRVIGRYRKTRVYIPGEDVLFPPPSAVKPLMDEYRKGFPDIKIDKPDDVFMLAAKVSHRFVRIHPYVDGNGRVSRLIMNMFLLRYEFLPVYLRADPTGSRRYLQSLTRANNGNYEWLAALIAMQTAEVYRRALDVIAAPK